MHTKTKSILAFLVVVSFLFAGIAERQKPQWKGKIEYKDEVKVIKNPKAPIYGEITFDLEEDLSIGNEEDDNYMFFGKISIALDTEGNIFVLDRGNRRIQKFDKEGNYLQTIGRKGQGPGEFENPFKFFIDSKDHLYVYDTRRFQIFNNRGEFLESIRPRTGIFDFFVNPEGNIFAYSGLPAEGGNKRAVVKIDSEGKLVETIAEYPDVEMIVRKSGDETYTFGFHHEYNFKICFSAISEQTFCYAHSSEYKVFIMDSKGNILHILQKNESPQTISRKEKNFMIDQMKKRLEERGRSLPKGDLEEGYQFPSHRPFFDKIIADDKQRLYVNKLKSVLDKDKGKEFEIDIFSKDGLYLYKTKLPYIPHIIKNGDIFEVMINEDTGEIKIIRYKVKNWRQIREEFGT